MADFGTSIATFNPSRRSLVLSVVAVARFTGWQARRPGGIALIQSVSALDILVSPRPARTCGLGARSSHFGTTIQVTTMTITADRRQETAVKRPENIFGDCPELESANA
jgi:hypothetical protein